MRDILEVIRSRRSSRGPFDPAKSISKEDLGTILEAARWAPTAHNIQNFEITVVDDPRQLEMLGDLRRAVSLAFIRENYEQLSFSEEELRRKKVGILAAMFPPSWRTPGRLDEEAALREPPSFLRDSLHGCPMVLVVTYDPRKRAPASEGDVLGMMSLGCVLENMWLAAESLRIAFQVLSVFAGESVEGEVKRVLAIPASRKIAFGIRLGYLSAAGATPRVRRDAADVAHYSASKEPR